MPDRRVSTSTGIVFALVLALTTGSFMVLMPLVVMATDPVDVGGGLPTHKQDAETLMYLVTFFVLLPGWLWFGPRLADRISSGPSGRGLSALTGLLAGLLAAAICFVRLSAGLPWNDGLKAILAAGIIWSGVAAFALVRASRDGEWKAVSAIATRSGQIWALTGLLTLAAALTSVRFGHIDLPALAIGLVVVLGITFAYGRTGLPAMPRPWGRVIDVLIVVLILLAIPDMIIMPVESVGSDPNAPFTLYVIQFHQNLWLGAASQVLGGSALLVDTVSQYGIAPIYLIAAFFKVAPIGHLTLGFFDAALWAGVFATGYLIIRAAGVGRLLAAAALAVGVVALVWVLTYPVGGLLQHGALRFGLPVLVVAFQVIAFRWDRATRPANLLSLAVLGLSSVWALEAFLYVSLTWFALVLMRLTWEPAGARVRWLVRRVLEVIAAWVVTQVLFLLLTLIFSGSVPDWGLYLSYLRDFLTGDVGDLTYDFTPWSRGFGVGAVYVASAIGLTLLSTRATGWSAAKKPAMIALAGLTGYGIGLFSYYDNRSLDHVLPYVSLPALLVFTIWLALCLELDQKISLTLRRAALGIASGLAALMLAVAWPAAGERAQDSLIAYALPGGESLSDGFHRLWNPPEFTAGAIDGEELIAGYLPDGEEVPVLTRPDLDVEILVRSGRSNSLGITDTKEMSWVPGPHRETIDDAVDALQPGDLMVVDNETIAGFSAVTEGSGTNELGYVPGVELEPVQVRALERIAERFRFDVVERRPSGVTVVKLKPR